MTDAERIRAALAATEPALDVAREKWNDGHAALDSLLAESERLREKALSQGCGLQRRRHG